MMSEITGVELPTRSRDLGTTTSSVSVLTGGTAVAARGEREAAAGLGWAVAGLRRGDDAGLQLGWLGRPGFSLFYFF